MTEMRAADNPLTQSKFRRFRKELAKDFKKNKVVYFMAIPVIAYYLIFHYGPMGGLVIAFKDYRPGRGIWGSDWAGMYGFQHFYDFFSSSYFWRLVQNTITISVVSIVVGFPMPIILALLLNEIKNANFKKSVQTITYMPHFISVVVMSGIIREMVGTEGIVTSFLGIFGYDRGNLLNHAEYFVSIFVGSNVWQNLGWGAIIYLAALAGVSEELYEAARIDGANRWQQVWNVTLPSIAPTITIMLIMRVGNVMSVGYEKVMLLYSPGIYETADVISTYIYRSGIAGSRTSYSTAIGMFNSVINFALLVVANKVGKKLNETGLW
ncbi:MAG: ABC transporter permease subunit [Eubacteriales bacterium]